MNAVEAQPIAPAAAPAQTRPMYWSIRRELWENRSIYLAPLIVAAVVLFGYLMSTIGLPQRRRAALLLDQAHQRAAIQAPYDAAAGMIIVIAFIVGVFYCLDALHGERRDRSILFWKSLPVSDRITVLSKAAVPLIILPLISLVIILVTQLIMLMLSTAVLLASGANAAMLSPQLRFTMAPVPLVYTIIVIALWHAPIYSWLLLISGWARRATFLWAVLPFVAIAFLEKIAFNTTHFLALVKYRLFGWFAQAAIVQPKGSPPIDPMSALTPGRFLATPGLWFGLIFAAVFLAAAVRLRRYREPM